MKEITSSKLIVLVSVFFIAFGNIAFFSNVADVYPVNMHNSLFLVSLPLVFSCITVFLLSLVCYRYTIKPVLVVLLVISSLTAYFMDTYNVIIDEGMIDNILKTDTAESFDLISLKQFLYLFFLGIVPSIFIYKAKIRYSTPGVEIKSRLKLAGSSLVIAIVLVLFSGDFYASFIREHKALRYYANPSYYIYSTGNYIGKILDSGPTQLVSIGLDAKTPEKDGDRELIIFVVGETARADHFSLNGYHRKTNPYLENERVLNFNNAWSCGTSTAESVPCMFSIYSHGNYSKAKAEETENLLDVLQHAGVNVLWLDNNSDSKGVAARTPYESYKSTDNNSLCDSECRDEGMLTNLQRYIDSHTQGDIFIVLHQMGNHGPAYYKRYPADFEIFKPVCATNQLESCTSEEIDNAYDNAILYTDYFLSEVIKLLKHNDSQFESGLFYASDHGESLGEYGLYLHGLPYMIAPDSQKHVPMIMWFSDTFEETEVNFDLLNAKTSNKYSHDNLFHTILGLFEIKTGVYNKTLDIIDHENEIDQDLFAKDQSDQNKLHAIKSL